MLTTRILTRMIIHFKISRTNFTLILREKIFRWFFSRTVYSSLVLSRMDINTMLCNKFSYFSINSRTVMLSFIGGPDSNIRNILKSLLHFQHLWPPWPKYLKFDMWWTWSGFVFFNFFKLEFMMNNDRWHNRKTYCCCKWTKLPKQRT
jgi:hypothetical protein